MKLKQIIVLTFILAILAAMIVWKNSRKSEFVYQQESTSLEVGLEPALATAVRIKKQDSEINIGKEGDAWRVASRFNAKADANKVRQLLEVVSDLSGEFRSNDAALLSDYEIENEKALRIEIVQNDGKNAVLLIGLARPDQRGIFLRLENSNAVYLSNDQLLVNMGLYGDLVRENPKADFWIDFRLLDLEIDSVSSITLIQSKDGKENIIFSLEKAADVQNPALATWKMKDAPESFMVDESKVKTYLHKFQFERAKEILDPAGQYGLENPDFKLVFGLADGAQKVMVFKKQGPEAGDQAVSVLGEPDVKLITATVFNSFQATVDFFKQEEVQENPSP